MPVTHPEHAAVNLVRLVDSLKSTTTGLEKQSWVEVRTGRQTVRYARELLEHVKAEQKMNAEQLKSLDMDVDQLERTFDSAVEAHPIPSTSKLPLQSSPKSAGLLDSASTKTSSVTLPQPPPKSASSPTTTLSSAPLTTAPARLPSVDAPQPTPAWQNVDHDDNDLLPLVSKTARDDLLGGVGKENGLGFMGTSQLHDELSEQLANMSTRLKDNAIYFSKSLEDEKSVLEGAGVVLEGNLEKTRSSKAKLSAVSKKTRGTTWLTLISILVVLFGFTWTMLLIRFS